MEFTEEVSSSAKNDVRVCGAVTQSGTSQPTTLEEFEFGGTGEYASSPRGVACMIEMNNLLSLPGGSIRSIWRSLDLAFSSSHKFSSTRFCFYPMARRTSWGKGRAVTRPQKGRPAYHPSKRTPRLLRGSSGPAFFFFLRSGNGPLIFKRPKFQKWVNLAD